MRRSEDCEIATFAECGVSCNESSSQASATKAWQTDRATRDIVLMIQQSAFWGIAFCNLIFFDVTADADTTVNKLGYIEVKGCAKRKSI
jgi:hypothetical protein